MPADRPQLVLLCGLPGAGKTTYAKAHYPSWTRLEQDEQRTLKRELRALDRALAAHQNIVVSDTNTTAARRRPFVEAALRAGYVVRCVYLATPFRVCVERSTRRARPVPRVAIAAKAKEFELPEVSEGFAEVTTVELDEQCICTSQECEHAGRCAERILGYFSDNYCDRCHLRA